MSNAQPAKNIKTASLTIEDVCEHVMDREERDVYESCLPFFQGALRSHDEEVEELQAKLAELEKPCVWTWYPKFSCYETSCGEGLGPGSSIGVKKAFTFCPYCGHRIELGEDAEA